MTIRRVRAGDWGLLRDVRLRALATDPRSFGSTHAEVAARDDRFWHTWATEHSRGQDHCTLLALLDRQAVGLVRIERDPERPAVFGIYSMWVAPDVRRRGLALRLLAEAERWIETSGGTEAELNVVDRAIPALRLYERAGYRLDGRSEPATHAGAVELGMRNTLAVRSYDSGMSPFECSEDEFAEIAGAELDALPTWIQEAISRNNVAIDVEDERRGSPRILGLFQSRTLGGTPMNEITLYRLSILRAAGTRANLRGVIHNTLLHEIGHLFGMTEGDLDEFTIGNNPRPGAQPVHPPRD